MLAVLRVCLQTPPLSTASHGCQCSLPHRFLEFCKENGGYTGCPFPAKLDLQQGQDLLQGLSKLSPSTSGIDRWVMVGQAGEVWEEVRITNQVCLFLS